MERFADISVTGRAADLIEQVMGKSKHHGNAFNVGAAVAWIWETAANVLDVSDEVIQPNDQFFFTNEQGLVVRDTEGLAPRLQLRLGDLVQFTIEGTTYSGKVYRAHRVATTVLLTPRSCMLAREAGLLRGKEMNRVEVLTSIISVL